MTYKIRNLLMALACVALPSCMDGDWDAPQSAESPYGNNAIEETNVVTIAQLKQTYQSVINASSAVQINEPTQIKAWVTGNDIGGNIYQQIVVQDATAAIVVGIQQGGLCGQLPIGQEVLIELNGLYVGGYGRQAQIGMPYNGGIGRMDRFTWQNHFRCLGQPDTEQVESLITEFSADMDIAEHCGKLMVIRGAELADADGQETFAPQATESTYNVNRSIKGVSNLVVRSSVYADFAADAMPTGPVDITGVFTRYNNTWQILLRNGDDIATPQN